MRVRHDEAIAADARDAAALHGAAMNAGVFANEIAVTNLETCGLVLERVVLRADTDDRERPKAIVAADLCRAMNDDVRDKFAVLTYFDLGADDAEWPDSARFRYACRGIDNGCGMDHAGSVAPVAFEAGGAVINRRGAVALCPPLFPREALACR